MRAVLAGVLLAFAGAGCGPLRGGDDEPAAVTDDQLASMVVPREELGNVPAAFTVDTTESGPRSAKKAADDTLDPEDTGASVKRAGWLAGYGIGYSDPERAALERGRGLIAVSTSADLFATDSSARAFILRALRGIEQAVGSNVEGVKLVDFEPFDIAVGDEAWGLEFHARVRGVDLYATGVYLRRDRIFAAGGYLRADARAMRVPVESLARKLDGRIQRVLAGELDEEPVADGAVDPKRLLLDANDFPLRLELAHEGAFGASGVHGYLREYDVAGGRLGSSKIIYLRTLAQVFESEQAATKDQAYFASTTGRNTIVRRYLRAFFKGRFEPTNVETRALDWGGRDAAAAFLFLFDAPKGRVEGVMLSVRAGRVRGGVTVFGWADDVDPADVLALEPQLQARVGA